MIPRRSISCQRIQAQRRGVHTPRKVYKVKEKLAEREIEEVLSPPGTKSATTSQLEQVRHKPPYELRRERGLVLALQNMTSNVNFSAIVRCASSFGVRTVLSSGNDRLVEKVARDPAHDPLVQIHHHRTLGHALEKYKSDGYRIVALEQTNSSKSLFQYQFPEKAVLIVGNERTGVNEELLRIAQDAVEIPVYQRPFSFNAAAASAMAIFEYCRQFQR